VHSTRDAARCAREVPWWWQASQVTGERLIAEGRTVLQNREGDIGLKLVVADRRVSNSTSWGVEGWRYASNCTCIDSERGHGGVGDGFTSDHAGSWWSV
jgi:hypothetical protein